MAFKIDQIKSAIQKQIQPKIEKPKVANSFSPTSPQANAAVYTKKADSSFQATAVKQQLNANYVANNTITAFSATPTITQQEAEQRADEIIQNNGGKENLNTDGVGNDLAEIARQNPADAWMVAQAMLGDEIDQDGKGKVEENDKDEIAQSFAESLSDTELVNVAKDENGIKLLERMQTHLLSGRVHSDEIQTAEKISNSLRQVGTFFGSSQGINPNSELAMITSPGTALDPNATPEEAAAGLKTPFGMGNDAAFQVQAFTDQLAAHKADPQWIQQYYSALGSDKAAELISLATTTSGYSNYLSGMGGSNQAGDVFLERTAIIRDSLETLRTSGNFSQTDMNNLVGSMVENGVNPNVAIEIFGKSTSSELQEMFVRAAIDNGNDALDTSASHVLAQMPTYQQVRILNDLSTQGKLDSFIQGAMAGQTEIPDLENLLRTGNGWETVKFGGVEKLLENAATQQSIPYAPYSYEPYPPQLQRDMFSAVSQGLTNSKAFGNFDENVAFKDNLASLFIRHQDRLLFDAQVNSEGENSGHLNRDFQNGLEKFFQLSLLSSPPGEKFEELSASVFKLINDGVTDLNNDALANRDQAAFDEFVRKHNGLEPTQYSQMLGEVLGSVLDATGFSQESINKDNAHREEVIKFYTGLAFAMIPSVGGKVAGGITNEIFKHFVEEGAKYFESQGRDNIKSQIESLIGGNFDHDDQGSVNQISELVLDIFDEGLQTLPNGSSINGDATRPQFDFQEKFRDGFDTASQFTRLDNAQ